MNNKHSYLDMIDRLFSQNDTYTRDYIDWVKTNKEAHFKFIRMQDDRTRFSFYFGCEDTGEEVLVCSLTKDDTDDNYTKLQSIIGILNL